MSRSSVWPALAEVEEEEEKREDAMETDHANGKKKGRIEL